MSRRPGACYTLVQFSGVMATYVRARFLTSARAGLCMDEAEQLIATLAWGAVAPIALMADGRRNMQGLLLQRLLGA